MSGAEQHNWYGEVIPWIDERLDELLRRPGSRPLTAKRMSGQARPNTPAILTTLVVTIVRHGLETLRRRGWPKFSARNRRPTSSLTPAP